MNRSISTLLLAISFCLVVVALWQTWRVEQRLLELESETHSLVGIMGDYLRFSEKLYLAGDAGNWELAGWYLWKLTKASRPVAAGKVLEYRGVTDYDVAALTRQMLEPAIDSVSAAIEAGDAALFQARYSELMNSCNGCHQVTRHGYVRVGVPERSAYPGQRFSPDVNR